MRHNAFRCHLDNSGRYRLLLSNGIKISKKASFQIRSDGSWYCLFAYLQLVTMRVVGIVCYSCFCILNCIFKSTEYIINIFLLKKLPFSLLAMWNTLSCIDAEYRNSVMGNTLLKGDPYHAIKLQTKYNH